MIQGQYDRRNYELGIDGQMIDVSKSMKSGVTRGELSLHVGEIELPQPEPLYGNTTAVVRLIPNGYLFNVAVPGPHVGASIAGLPTGVGVVGIHGLWDDPLPGQQVVVGFINGSTGSPVVLNKYAYNPSQNPIREVSYTLPNTQLGIFMRDVVLGSYTGSYIALRGLLPIPGNVEISAAAMLDISARITCSVSALMTTTVSGMLGVEVSSPVSAVLKDGITGMNKVAVDAIVGKVDIVGLTQVNIKAIGGMLNLGKAPSGFVNNLPFCLFTGAPHSTCLDVRA